jgi:ABC-2 type transport system permease protein
MTNSSEHMTDAPSTPPLNATRPFYWSVRREIWENRSLYLAPLAVAGLVMVGLLFSTIGMAQRRLQTLQLPPAKQVALISQPYDFAQGALMVTAFIVAIVYCLGALHGERRDRSVLFWKSLPVSDRTTVLAKAFIPMAVLPVITGAIIIALQLAMYVWSAVVLATHGVPQPTYAQLPIGEVLVVVLYSLAAATLWYAPLYGWFIMVSGWARRVPFLWAVLPPAALCLFEKLAFNSTHLTKLMGDRFFGFVTHAFVTQPAVVTTTEVRRTVVQSSAGGAPDLPPPVSTPPVGHAAMAPGPHGMPQAHSIGLADIDLGKFLSTPGLWIGLVVAAAFIAASVWLRRRREPL